MHTADAIKASQYLANFYVGEARKNSHQFTSYNAQYKSVIYNWNPIFTLGEPGQNFPDVETYMFTNLNLYYNFL